jgi:hypothetical protein
VKRRGFNLSRNNVLESTFFKAWRSQTGNTAAPPLNSNNDSANPGK